jgi:hypothetical protein
LFRIIDRIYYSRKYKKDWNDSNEWYFKNRRLMC